MSIQTAAYMAVQRDITQIFQLRADAAKPFWPLLATKVDSNSADEKYAWLGSLPGMREWLGPREFKQLLASDYTLKNKHWESSLEFEKNDIDDDRMGGFRARTEALADEATFHPDELLMQVLVAGESQVCYDGQYFYDTDHIMGDSGTQSNKLTYDASSHTAVTSAEFRAAFHAALIKLLGYKNDQGKFFNRPTVGKLGNLVCTVPLALYEAAAKAFEQQIVVEGGAGVTNFTLEKPLVVPVQYLTSNVKWQLHYTGGQIKPFVFQARKPLSFDMKGADDIEYKALKAMTEARYNVGYGAWHTSVQTEFN